MEKPVIIIGLTTYTQGVIDIFESNEIVIYGILDDRKELHGKEVREIPVLSNTTDQEYLKLLKNDCEVFVTGDENAVRSKQIENLRKKYKRVPVNAIHQSSILSSSCSMGHGNYIAMGATVGAGVELQSNIILNSNVSLGISVTIGDYSNLGQGVIVGNECSIGSNVFIGTGAVIVPGITIGDNARIGAGSVVVEEVKENTTVYGNPAKVVEV